MPSTLPSFPITFYNHAWSAIAKQIRGEALNDYEKRYCVLALETIEDELAARKIEAELR